MQNTQFFSPWMKRNIRTNTTYRKQITLFTLPNKYYSRGISFKKKTKTSYRKYLFTYEPVIGNSSQRSSANGVPRNSNKWLKLWVKRNIDEKILNFENVSMMKGLKTFVHIIWDFCAWVPLVTAQNYVINCFW